MRSIVFGSSRSRPLLWLCWCAVFVSGAPSFGQETFAPPAEEEIRIVLRKYEFQPNQLRVKQGERVRVVLTALDRRHGFQIKEFGIKTEVEKGKETVVEFVASRAGEFAFRCSVFCGLGHWRMKGTLLVEADGPHSPSRSKQWISQVG